MTVVLYMVDGPASLTTKKTQPPKRLGFVQQRQFVQLSGELESFSERHNRGV